MDSRRGEVLGCGPKRAASGCACGLGSVWAWVWACGGRLERGRHGTASKRGSEMSVRAVRADHAWGVEVEAGGEATMLLGGCRGPRGRRDSGGGQRHWQARRWAGAAIRSNGRRRLQRRPLGAQPTAVPSPMGTSRAAYPRSVQGVLSASSDADEWARWDRADQFSCCHLSVRVRFCAAASRASSLGLLLVCYLPT